jgi:uncharacterized repeat protein (TIGR03806 family)
MNIINLYSISILLGFSLAAISANQATAQVEQETANHVALERAYPTLRFDRPVYLTGANDQSGRLFVVEQDGVVRWFNQNDEKPEIKTFLDIREQVSRKGNEEGLIGFAFHPEHSENGYVYCHYSADKIRTGEKDIASNVVSRFKVKPDQPNSIDLDSEKIILTVDQPFANHNGGAMAFGKDGFLYLSLGDGGYKDDPHGNGQKVSSLLGAILRIDINNESDGKAYSIPTDNPFVNDPAARPELFAIGLRNVWRFSIDRKTGELWAADVGQNLIEEVNIVKKGGNYGWNRFEANDDFATETKLAIERHDKPVAFYGHEWGGSITGGNVYRGKRFPELEGSYFFGDYMTGNLWRTQKDSSGEYQTELARRTGRSIASFGEDDDGEVFVLSFDGGIYRVVPTSEPEATFADWPKKLSETDLYVSVKDQKISKRLTPYTVNAPFWSDNAGKERFFKIPEGKKLTYREKGTWEVPVGATIVKNFYRMQRRNRKMMETRLIKRTDDGWESATYVWNKQNDEAELMPQGKQFEIWSGGVTSWHAPSSSECSACHVDAAGYVLGMNTLQLNRNSDNGENQILQWSKAGLVELPDSFDPASTPKYCSPFDESADLETRARVYLDVNCAMCHQPNGPGNANIDLRFATKLEDTKMIGVRGAQGDLGLKDALLVSPGNPDSSLMVHRIQTKSVGRMPSIGSNVVDEKAVKLLSEWIAGLE